MRRVGFWTALMGAGLAAGAAVARPGTGYAVVPPAERLTVGRVFANAAPEVQVVFAILLISVLAVVAIWAISLPKVAKGDAPGLAGALGRLRIVRSAATPL